MRDGLLPGVLAGDGVGHERVRMPQEVGVRLVQAQLRLVAERARVVAQALVAPRLAVEHLQRVVLKKIRENGRKLVENIF